MNSDNQYNLKYSYKIPRRQVLIAGMLSAFGAQIIRQPQAQAQTQKAAKVSSKFLKLKDGIRLHYLEAGHGQPVIFVPGWSQSASIFGDQLQGLSKNNRIISVDMRGHGDSSKPDQGYRISKLASDLHEFINALNLTNVTLAGHSLGAAVIWSYWSQFDSGRISRMVVIDQPTVATAWPGWTSDQKAETGAVFTPQSLFDTASSLAGVDGEKTTEQLIRNGFFSKDFPADKMEWVIKENMKLPRVYAAKLMVDLGGQDWRDIIPTIKIPSMVFGGENSICNPRSQQWIANTLPRGRVHIFGKDEQSGHFAFLENSTKFNYLIGEFLRNT